MTANICIQLLIKMNENSFHHYCIKINEIVDIALIPKHEFENTYLEDAQPKEYKKVFLLKKNNIYVGCFFANTDYKNKQTDLQLFILEEYRGKLNYISSFNDYVFPSLFVEHDKLKISFKHDKIKNKFAEMEIFSKLNQIKGRKITIHKKEIVHLLKNDTLYLKNHLQSWENRYNSLKEILEPFVKRGYLENIIKDEKFSRVNKSYINYYYDIRNINTDEVIKDHIECVELYFLIKLVK